MRSQHFWNGKLRSCDACRQLARKCTYHPRQPSACARCISFKIPCSGPSLPPAPAVRRTETVVNIAPSSTRGRLVTFTLSSALTYHLILSGIQIFRQTPKQGSLKLRHFLDFHERFLLHGGNLPDIGEDYEIICLHAMCTAARTTTHSAIVGSKVSSLLPTAPSLDEAYEVGSLHLSPEIHHAGLSRALLYEALSKKLTTHVTNLSREILTLPLLEGLVRLESVWSVWGVVATYGVLSLEEELGMLDLVVPVVGILCLDPVFVDEDQTSLGIGELLGNMKGRAQQMRILLGLKSISPRSQMPAFPQLYSLSPDDIDSLLAFQDHGHVGHDIVTKREAAYRRWASSIETYKVDLTSRAEVQATISSPSTVADLFWDACEFLSAFTDLEVGKILGDERYHGPICVQLIYNLVGTVAHYEIMLFSELLVLQNRAGDPNKSRACAMTILDRISTQCKRMEEIRKPNPISLVKQATIWQIVITLSYMEEPVLENGCKNMPQKAQSVLNFIRGAGFIYPEAAHLVQLLTTALAQSASSTSTAESTAVTKLACDMVDGALMEIKTKGMVENALMDVMAQGMMDSALKELE